MKANNNKVELKEETEAAILNDAELALKVINALGGEISLPALIARVNRKSKNLLKKSVLETISAHMNKPVSELVRTSKVRKIVENA